MFQLLSCSQLVYAGSIPIIISMLLVTRTNRNNETIRQDMSIQDVETGLSRPLLMLPRKTLEARSLDIEVARVSLDVTIWGFVRFL